MYNGWNIILEEICFFTFKKVICTLNKSTATLRQHFSCRFLYTTICSSGLKHKRSENKQEGIWWLNTDQWSNMFPLWTFFFFFFFQAGVKTREPRQINTLHVHQGTHKTIHYKNFPKIHRTKAIQLQERTT